MPLERAAWDLPRSRSFFGEPDLRVLKEADGLIRVEIKGMDIFDPTTGEVRSSGGSELKNDVAAWFVDDDYNEESFFVRQAYFVGQDPYESLRRPPLPEARLGPHLRQSHQPFRRRGAEGFRPMTDS
jgi:hypothetical protein